MTLILSGTDGLSDVDGTAATPAIRGTDANTGIFFGTDIIGFSEGGVEAMRIDASGNVGIGSSPAATSRLQVSSTGSTRLLVENTTNSVQLRIQTLTATALIQTDTNHALTFATNNGAEAMRINAGAPILCLAGGSTTATGTGIAFPATQSASTDANTLDDYEEGAWTATLTTTGTGFSSVSYTLNTGRYVKIGRLVNISLRFTTSAVTVGPATGSVTISGLPFASSGNSTSSTTNGFNANWGGNAPNFVVVFDASSIINLYRYPASGGYSAGLPTLVADVATGVNSNYVYINFSYETAS